MVTDETRNRNFCRLMIVALCDGAVACDELGHNMQCLDYDDILDTRIANAIYMVLAL